MEVNTVLYCFIHFCWVGTILFFKTSGEGVKQQADWHNQCWVDTFPSLPLDLLTLLLSPIVYPCTGRCNRARSSLEAGAAVSSPWQAKSCISTLHDPVRPCQQWICRSQVCNWKIIASCATFKYASVLKSPASTSHQCTCIQVPAYLLSCSCCYSDFLPK